MLNILYTLCYKYILARFLCYKYIGHYSPVLQHAQSNAPSLPLIANLLMLFGRR